jgi:hypothetical protein
MVKEVSQNIPTVDYILLWSAQPLRKNSLDEKWLIIANCEKYLNSLKILQMFNTKTKFIFIRDDNSYFTSLVLNYWEGDGYLLCITE